MASNHILQSVGNENLAASASQSVSGGFLPARQVLDRYRVSQMTLWRWVHDEGMAFPQPVYLGRYRYWRISDLEAWEAAQEIRGAA